jgi:hypothetical protein
MSEMPDDKRFVSAAELLEKLFTEFLTADEYDAEIVSLTKEHLGVVVPASKAGNNLARALINLAQERSKGGE